MKKTFMFAMAALVLASCGDKDFSASGVPDGYKNASDVEIVYARAFESVFGTPDANQTWGFGSVDVNKAMAKRRAIQPSYDFPDDADASKFLTDVPAGVEKLTQNVARANNWIDETWTGEINIWGGATAEGNWQDRSGGTLYIKGNCDFTDRKFYFDGNSELYLIAGATLTLGESSSIDLQQNTMIYIAPGAKLITKGTLHLNNGLHIYNHGEIEAPTLSTNSTSRLYNVGTVTINGNISVENTESVIVNEGTITAANLYTAGSGKFLNADNGNVTISGTTFVNSNENTWVNDGQYETGYFVYNAGSKDVINNCMLTVNEDFNINLGDSDGSFKNAGGVVTKNFNGGGNWTGTFIGIYNTAQGGPFYINMSSGAVFKVTDTATMNASKADYGIYGPNSGDYAVFQAKNIVAGKALQGYEVTYGGNLAVAAESHFENGLSGSYPYIDFKGNAKIYAPGFESGLPNITIKATKCNPGFQGGDTPNPDPLPSLHVMAEDLSATSASDFDFNDVVIDVFYVDANTVEIKLLAAGGTLPLRIDGKDEWEVHKLFGVDEKCMVNTGTKYHVAKAPYSQETKPYVTLTLTGYTWSTDQDEFAAQVNTQVKLEVKKDGIWHELTAYKGAPAAKIATPVDIYMKNVTNADGKNESWYSDEYRWPWEKQDFSALFKEYVTNGSQWYVTKKVTAE